jgi:malonate decarboxylase gamma subunit
MLDRLISGVDADAPSHEDVRRVRGELVESVAGARSGPRDLLRRLASPAARESRAASAEVRRRLAAQWDAA